MSPPLSDLIFKKYYIHFFYVHWYISYVYACVRRYQIAWKCSYRQLWGTMWMMGIEPGFSGTAASAQNHWTKLLAPTAWLFKMDLWVSACVRACVCVTIVPPSCLCGVRGVLGSVPWILEMRLKLVMATKPSYWSLLQIFKHWNCRGLSGVFNLKINMSQGWCAPLFLAL